MTQQKMKPTLLSYDTSHNIVAILAAIIGTMTQQKMKSTPISHDTFTGISLGGLTHIKVLACSNCGHIGPTKVWRSK